MWTSGIERTRGDGDKDIWEDDTTRVKTVRNTMLRK